jgi:hypothetical protein
MRVLLLGSLGLPSLAFYPLGRRSGMEGSATAFRHFGTTTTTILFVEPPIRGKRVGTEDFVASVQGEP